MYTHNKFIIEKWVNRRYFFIDEKKLQKLGLTRQLISAHLYYKQCYGFATLYRERERILNALFKISIIFCN